MQTTSNRALTTMAMTWPVMISNGSVLCGRELEHEDDSWYCWARLAATPDDPSQLTEISPAKLAALIIGHIREAHLPR